MAIFTRFFGLDPAFAASLEADTDFLQDCNQRFAPNGPGQPEGSD